MGEALLAVEDLRVHLEADGGTVRAVDGVSLRIGAGETVGLVGESGCGKSMTALSLLGLAPAPAARVVGGSVRYAGRELVAAPEAELRHVRGAEIAIVFQDPLAYLHPMYTVGRQIAETIQAHTHVPRPQADARVVELLREVGLPAPEERLRQFPHELSGGMRQRVMLAMALACRPRLLIADEPTTALDATIQLQILHLMRRLIAERGMALLLITHDLGIVAQMCDRVLVMYAGQIVEEAPVAELFAQPRHPYTEGLLGAVRGSGPDARGPLHAIPGAVPNLARLPAGCRFHPRCPLVEERCRRGEPDLLEAAPGRAVRCWVRS